MNKLFYILFFLLASCPGNNPSTEPIIKVNLTKLEGVNINIDSKNIKGVVIDVDTLKGVKSFKSNGVPIYVKNILVFQDSKNLTIEDTKFVYTGGVDSLNYSNPFVKVEATIPAENLTVKNTIFKGARNTAFYIRGIYNKGDKHFNYKKITLNNITIDGYRAFGLMVHGSQSNVKVNNIKIIQNKEPIYFAGGSKGLAFSTDIYFNKKGMNINIDTLKIKKANSSFLYLQNPQSYNINYIESDSAMWNGSVNSSGVAFIKLKYFGDMDIDRHFYINKIVFKNSKVDSVKGGRYRNAFRLVDNFNTTINNASFDLPISTNSRFNDTSNVYYKKLTVYGRFKCCKNNVKNAKIDSLFLFNTYWNSNNNVEKYINDRTQILK